MSLLPPYLRYVLNKAEQWHLEPGKVWLFGSRARGDARENSDFDIAFQISNTKNWSRFVTDIADDPPSLHQYDLVDFDRADKPLQNAILKDGLVIYESIQR